MRREAVVARHAIDDVRRAVHRFERADPEANNGPARVDRDSPTVRFAARQRRRIVPGIQRSQQLVQRRRRLQIPPVRSEVHAGQRDLLEAGAGDPVDLRHDSARRHAPGGASRCRDDAVGAWLRTAGLHPQRERGTAGDPGLDRRSAAAVTVAEPLGCRQAEIGGQQRHDARLVAVRHDPEHVGEAAELVGTTSGVAPGDDHLRIRIDARQTPDRLPRALIGARGHRTGVDDHDVCVVRRCRRRCAAAAQVFLEPERIGLIDAAAEGDD